MRLSSFFRHCETDFFPKFFYCSSHQFLIFCNRMDAQKIPKRPPFYIFWHYTFYRKLQKKISRKKSEFFFPIFSFLRAFVVSSCRKSGFRFRVFLSLRYGADLGRSRLLFNFRTKGENLTRNLSFKEKYWYQKLKNKLHDNHVAYCFLPIIFWERIF